MKYIYIIVLISFNLFSQELKREKVIDTIFVSNKIVFLDLSKINHTFIDTQAPINIEKSGNDNVFRLYSPNPFIESFPLLVATEFDTYIYVISYKKEIKMPLYKIDKNLLQNQNEEKKVVTINNENDKFSIFFSKNIEQNISIKNEENGLETIVGGIYTINEMPNDIYIAIQLLNKGIKKYTIDYSEFILEKKLNNDYQVLSQKPIKCNISKTIVLNKNEKDILIISMPKIQINESSRIKISLHDSNNIEIEDLRSSNIYINSEEFKNVTHL